MLPTNLGRDPSYELAYKEWNEAQRSVVESFQKSLGGAGEWVVYLVAALLATVFLLVAYSIIKRFRR